MTEAGSAILTSISASIARTVAWERDAPRSSKTSVSCRLTRSVGLRAVPGFW